MAELHLVPESRHAELKDLLRVALGLPQQSTPTTVLGFQDPKGEFIVGWMFERYTGVNGSIVMHWAARGGNFKWLTKDMLTMCAIYVFDQLQCYQAVGEIVSSNTYAQKLAEKLNFKRIGVIPHYFPNDDLFIYTLQKQDCQWLPAIFKEDY